MYVATAINKEASNRKQSHCIVHHTCCVDQCYVTISKNIAGKCFFTQ